MTKKQAIQRKIFVASALYALHFVGVVALMKLPVNHPSVAGMLSQQGWILWIRAWSGASMLVSAGFVWYVLNSMRCPACGKFVRAIMKYDACPHCGDAWSRAG